MSLLLLIYICIFLYINAWECVYLILPTNNKLNPKIATLLHCIISCLGTNPISIMVHIHASNSYKLSLCIYLYRINLHCADSVLCRVPGLIFAVPHVGFDNASFTTHFHFMLTCGFHSNIFMIHFSIDNKNKISISFQKHVTMYNRYLLIGSLKENRSPNHK